MAAAGYGVGRLSGALRPGTPDAPDAPNPPETANQPDANNPNPGNANSPNTDAEAGGGSQLPQFVGGEGRPPVTNPTPQQAARATELGVDPRWVTPNGDIDWPPNNGFSNNVISIRELQPGQTFDRYGGRTENGEFQDQGQFASPVGVSFEQRALPPSSRNLPRSTYEVVRPIPNVNQGQAAPWFDQPGGGTQYQLPFSIDYLLENGFIRRVR